MTASVFPVGHYTGILPSAIGPAQYVVRVGRTQHRLDEAAFGVWMVAHGPVESSRGPWSTRDLLKQAKALNLPEPGQQLEYLAAAGLVVLVDQEDQERFARTHRLHVLLVGLGDTAERPGYHRIGLPDVGPVTTLDPESYELWQWAATTPNLWASCELRSAVTVKDGEQADPRRALAGVLTDLRVLILHGCGYLDVVE